VSNPQHPIGRQPRRVYRRRRAALGVIVLAAIVVVGVFVLLGRSNSGAESTTAHGTTGTASAAPRATPTPTTPATPQDCAPRVVDVEAVTDANSYSSGQLPKLSFTVTNTGRVACVFNAGTAKQVFTITSGSQTYWTSTDCQTAPQDQQILLEPGKTVGSGELTWGRTESSPTTCSDQQRPAVPAGGAAYHLQVTVDGVMSRNTPQFLLY
jgi:hypothetical protein